MKERELTEYVRQSHQSLGSYLPQDEYMPWDWVDAQVSELSERLYKEMPHWHHWSGYCIGVVPFELRIAAMGTFGALWFYEIMLRKARDRDMPASWERVEEWRRQLEEAMDYIREDIRSTRDPEAEGRHRRDSRPISRVRHWWSSLMWGH